MAVGGGLFQGIQVDKLLYMKWLKVFILATQIHSFVYICNVVDSMGYVHIVFIIFFLESMLSTTRGTGRTLACSPFVVWFW